TYDVDDLTIVKNQMQKIAESVSLLFNVTCEVKFEEGYPPTMNSPKLREPVEQALNNANLEVIDKPTPFLFGEDFS
ncbi:hydrolase, partial [Staphylococcus hominis]